MYIVNFVGLADYNKLPVDLDNVKIMGAPADVLSNAVIRKVGRIFTSYTVMNRINIPVSNVLGRFFLKFKKEADAHKGVCFVFNAHYYWVINKGLAKFIKKNIKSSHIVFCFSDTLSMYRNKYKDFPKISDFKKNSDLIFTYNIIDAKRYNIPVSPFCFPSFPILKSNQSFESDVFFVGKNKNRLSLLVNLYDRCSLHGIKCKFFVSDVAPMDRVYRDGIMYKKIPYIDVLNFVNNTKCVVNILQDNAQGITMRDYEALYYNKYLLTNNEYIFRTPLYRRSQVIDFNKDYITSLKEKINYALPPHPLIANYDLNNFYKWVEGNIAI